MIPGRRSPRLVFDRADCRWMDAAACANQPRDIFFPDGGRNTDLQAKAICAGCPVRANCLDYALATHSDHGVWGGLNATEREHILRGTAHRRAQRPIEKKAG